MKGVQKNGSKKDLDKYGIRTIKIIRKAIFDAGEKKPTLFYGIAIFENNKEIYRPVYPFMRAGYDSFYLEKFIKKYEQELLDFYKNGHNHDFGCFVYGIGSGRKDRFRDEWFAKGLVVY